MNGIDWAGVWAQLSKILLDVWDLAFFFVVVVVAAFVIRWVLVFVIERVVGRIVNGVKKRNREFDTQVLFAGPLAAARLVQRTRTLGSVLGNVVSAAIIIIATLVLVNYYIPNATSAFALITAALGAGLGFGAQGLVKDILSGLFIVAEDQLGVGDVVDVGFATGIVEEVQVRITKVRDVNGTLWFVRNGEIVRVGNMSQGWARVIIDLAVPYDSDTDAVQARILDTAVDLSRDPKWSNRILEKPEIWGIESISAEAVVLRLVVKTATSAKDDVARELRARLKTALDEAGIHLPALNTITLSGVEGAGSVRGARPPRTRPVPTVTKSETE